MVKFRTARAAVFDLLNHRNNVYWHHSG